MSEFNFGDAWSEGVAFLQANVLMLAIVIGGGLAVSELVQFFAGGDGQAAQIAMLQRAFTSGDFGQLAGANAAAGGGLAAGLAAMFAGLIQGSSSFAAYRLGLAPDGDDNIASALLYGFIATLLFILAIIPVAIIVVIVIAIPVAAFGLGSGGAPGGGTLALAIIFGLAFLVLILWLSARLSVVQPAMAAARSTNPIYGVTESWRLTDGKALMIFLYLLLIGIATMVVGGIALGLMAAIGSVLGAFATVILTLAVTIPITMVSAALTAGIYRSLVPDDHSQTFA